MVEVLLNSNPFALLAVGVVIVFILMFIFVRPDKKKSNKNVDKKKEEVKATKQEKAEDEEKINTEDVDKNKDENVTESSVDEDEEENSVNSKKKKVKKAKTKPEITQVYQRTEKKEVVNENVSDDGISEELLSRAQFVNTSKTVSKFAGFNAEQKEDVDDELISEEFSEEISGNCEECKRIITHFDRSRRLSKIIKEDSFDQMFMDHLTDRYMNIDVNKHLHDIDKRIYERASEMLSNSDVKVLVDSEDSDVPVHEIKNDKDFMRAWLESRKTQQYESLLSSDADLKSEIATERFVNNDVKITAKNLIVSNAVMNRKGLKRNRK